MPLRPKVEAKLHVILNEVKNPTEKLIKHILFTSVVGYFACAQYDVLFIPYRHFVPLPPKEEAKFVFASMSSEQTCLQGFASDDIHKALAFLIKNAENESFNAPALSAE